MADPDEGTDPTTLRDLLDFSKFGFRGTLTGAIVGLLIVPVLAYLLKDSAQSTAILIAYCTALVIGVVSFGYFSLRQVPNVVANLVKGEFAISEERLTSRVAKLEAEVQRLRQALDKHP